MNNNVTMETKGFDHLSDFSENGEMGSLIASKDWSSTPLGPISEWPDSLKYYLKLMLGSKYQMWLWWGPEYYNFYNDAYAPTLGVKHPDSLGKSSKIIWKEIWDVIGPMVDGVRTTGKSLYHENLILFLERHGFKEETYHTFSYSPLPDGKGGIGGVFCAVSEDTKKVLSQRRLATLHNLYDTSVNAQTLDDVCSLAANVLDKNPNDVPFAFIYLLEEGRKITLKASSGHNKKDKLPELDLADINQKDIWNFSEVLNSNQSIINDTFPENLKIPNGPWDESPSKVITLPILKSGHEKIAGFLVVGLSSRLSFDEEYQNFLTLVTGQISTALSKVRALEEERKRAEALTEIDKAKTVFFSNVSHEFRTPLTLMLGPLKDILDKDDFKSQESKEQLSIVYRNSLRLLKLVNTLLDFSRLEAGRVQAVFVETDIAELTSNLSSAFRSAIESAGLKFTISIQKLKGAVYVDHTMWERIIFNLLSNAFKFTFQGEISVSLIQKESIVELKVSDTGTGIPKEELHKLFSRFHRIENSRGRTHEGSGIGLAMVFELVKIHGGTIDVQSTLGVGTTFTITIPVGSNHLPGDRIVSEQKEKQLTLNSLPDLDEEFGNFNYQQTNIADFQTTVLNEGVQEKETILIADDNADMREYLTKLLKDRYNIVSVCDGVEALKLLETVKPSLLLSDVMMPNLDGLGLVKKLRSELKTSTLPVILISARAGEEATIDGIQAGADDYLIKPFSARELISRVDSNIRIAKTRQFAEKNLQNVFKQAHVALSILKGDDLIIEMANQKSLEIWGKTAEQVINKPTIEAFPEIIDQGFDKILYNVYRTGERFVGNEVPVELIRFGKREIVYINFVYDALRDPYGKIIGVMSLGYDVTELVNAKKAAEKIAYDLELANKDVTSKNELLSRINTDLDNFIYTASHDLKAPISNIEGLLQSMMDSLNEETRNNEDFNVIMELIDKSIAKFKNTILDLTEISKTQRIDEEDINEINCEEVIEDVKFSIADKIKESNAEILVNISECYTLKFSRKNFQSIVYNLLSNAIKYRDPNRPLKIIISVVKIKGFIRFTLSDNGMGISEVNKSKLFTMFKRFHNHVEGTGIGLYIVKRIVDNAGGKIEVESKENYGTKFNVYFPDNN